MRLVFMGTPDFAVPVLHALCQAGHDVVRVYTQPPRRAGRGKALRNSPVHDAAEERGITAHTPESFRDDDVLGELEAIGADAAVVVAYGQILPQRALDAPRLGCLNLHASLLPRWRGAAPIQRAIMAGDQETGIAVMQMVAGLDTGPVLAEVRTDITTADTASSLHDRLAGMGVALIVETLPRIAEGTVAPNPQAGDGVTYARKIDKAEARIDWTHSGQDVDRQIRGLSPFPGAWFELKGERVKVLMSEFASERGEPGEALDNDLKIACGDGSVRLITLQRAGRGPVSGPEFLNGLPVRAGDRLG